MSGEEKTASQQCNLSQSNFNLEEVHQFNDHLFVTKHACPAVANSH
jgi:hypothetical protein